MLSGVDALALGDIYAAGEAPIVAADGRARCMRCVWRDKAKRCSSRTSPTCRRPFAEARDGDVVVTMGAGSIGGVPGKLAPSPRKVPGVRAEYG